MNARIGSLFSGYGGLEMGIASVLDAETAWHVEIESAPSRILAHHWPDIPNHGDITTVDWARLEPIDILCGGFPCQDVSLAGLRRGLKPDTRSGLWSHFALAIAALRPQLVIVENVRGLLSAEAHSDLEPDPWALGDGNVRPALRALGAVLGDLADLGYDAEWHGVRAADAGAPHSRHRIFLAAHTRSERGEPWTERGDRRLPFIGSETRDHAHHSRGSAPSNTGHDGRGGSRPAHDNHGGLAHRDDLDRRDPTATHTDGGGHGLEEDARPVGRVDIRHAGEARQRERARSLTRDRSATHWGEYEPAIRRWEAITGHAAPAPTETGSLGGHRLSPRFVEWMMGLPAGHVTDPAIGLTRNEQLKALGNGVVPQQAALALTYLLARQEAAA